MRILKLRARIVKENNLLIAAIHIDQATKACTNIDDALSGWGHQAANSNPLSPVFIGTSAALPEFGAVIRAFVVANRGRVVHSQCCYSVGRIEPVGRYLRSVERARNLNLR